MGGPMLQPGSVSVHLLTYYLSNFTLTFPSKFCPLALPLASYKMLDPVSFVRGILEREHYFKRRKVSWASLASNHSWQFFLKLLFTVLTVTAAAGMLVISHPWNPLTLLSDYFQKRVTKTISSPGLIRNYASQKVSIQFWHRMDNKKFVPAFGHCCKQMYWEILIKKKMLKAK